MPWNFETHDDIPAAVSRGAATHWVAKTGNNSNSGTSEGQAKLTIAAALAVMGPGDKLCIKAGTYNERIVIPHSGTSEGGGEFVVMGDPNTGASGVIIDGGGLSGTNGIVDVRGVNDVIIQGLRVTDSSDKGIYVDGNPTPMYRITIRDCIVDTCDDSGIFVVGTRLGNNPDLDVYTLEDALIYNNEVTNVNINAPPGNEAITSGGGARYIHAWNNWVHDTNRYGIDFKFGIGDFTIAYNLVHDVGHHNIYLDANTRQVRRGKIFGNVCFNGPNGGITILREAGPSRPNPQQAITDIDVFNNVVYDCNYGLASHKDPDDNLSIGEWRDVRYFNNTIVDCNIEVRFLDLNAGVVQDIQFANNIFARSNGGNVNIQNSVSGQPGYVWSNNFQTSADDIDFTNAAGNVFTLTPASDGYQSISNLTYKPVYDIDGDTRPTPFSAGAYEEAGGVDTLLSAIFNGTINVEAP